MRKPETIFHNPQLTQAVDFSAYFLLLHFVAPTTSWVRIAAGILAAAALMILLARLVIVLRRKADAPPAEACTRCSRFCEALTPVGFLVLALVLTPPENPIVPLLYAFLGLYVLTAFIKGFVRTK